MDFLSRTFGKLNRAFYMREFFFGLIFYIPLLYVCYVMYTENEGASFFQIFLLALFFIHFCNFFIHTLVMCIIV